MRPQTDEVSPMSFSLPRSTFHLAQQAREADPNVRINQTKKDTLMFNSMKLATVFIAGMTLPAFAQDTDYSKLTCSEFAAIEGDAQGVVAMAVINSSPMVGALARLEGFSPVQLIAMGCLDDSTSTALAAAEKRLSR